MATSLELSIPPRRKFNLTALKQFFPPILGTVLEYYDYTLYGFCASLLAEQFFPIDDPTVALLKTFGVFLAGSLSKPFGALLFGYTGDRYGRSVSLKISMMGIAIPTICIGLIPTYHDIGWVAPFLLLICRIFQGILTSGESDGVRVFIFETFFKTRPCFSATVSSVACMFGIYLASVVSSFVITSADPALWWRFPFILGGIIGIFVFWMRRTLHETPDFINYQNSNKVPTSGIFLKTFLNNKLIILVAILFCGASGGTYHFYLVFLGKYLSTTLGILDPKSASFATSGAILVYTISALLAAFLADCFGYIKIIKISFYGLLIAIAFNINRILNMQMSIGLMWVTAGLLSFSQTPMFALLLEKTSVGERCRCLGFGHAVGSMIFSGSAPLISLWLWHVTKIEMVPFLYFIALALIGFLAVFLLKNK